MRIEISCPAMGLSGTLLPCVKRTAKLLCPDCKLWMPDNRIVPFAVTFASVKVRWNIWTNKGTVDQAPADGVAIENGFPLATITLLLDFEGVVPVDADTKKALAVQVIESDIAFADGRHGHFDGMVFPEVLSHKPPGSGVFGPYTVDPVLAVGDWEYA